MSKLCLVCGKEMWTTEKLYNPLKVFWFCDSCNYAFLYVLEVLTRIPAVKNGMYGGLVDIPRGCLAVMGNEEVV